MDKLLSKNAVDLLRRIRDAEDGKIQTSSLSESDHERLQLLYDHHLVESCDPYFPKNDPNSSVYVVGPLHRSVKLSSAGMDYLSDLAQERKSGWLRFGRDVLMLIIGAAVVYFFDHYV